MKNIRSTWKYLPLPMVIFLLGSWLAWAQSAKPPKGTPPAAAPSAQHATAPANPGERAFQENCGRCHNPPEQLSPRITGTVLRHMRVRALLSPQDEHDILKYLAP
jgi:mono/diheme cytochrome c family protein